jgi:hypothetical protein
MGGRPPLSSTEHSIRKEIAVMKKCRHANIVRLFEVIDDPQQDKIFLGEAWSRSILTRYAEDCLQLSAFVRNANASLS